MCQKLRDLGFVDVYGDDVKDPMDLLPILAAVAVKERHLNRTIFLGDARPKRDPMYGQSFLSRVSAVLFPPLCNPAALTF